MNYLKKRKIMKELKNNPNASLLREIVKHPNLLKLESYEEICRDVLTIGDKSTLYTIVNIIKCHPEDKFYEFVVSQVVKLRNSRQVDLFYKLYNEISSANYNYLEFVYSFFIKLDNVSRQEIYVDFILSSSYALKNLNYTKIINDIFLLDNIEKIRVLCNLIGKKGNDVTKYDDFIYWKLFLYEDEKYLELMGNFMLENTDLPDFEKTIERLEKIKDIKVLKQMINILQDDSFIKSKYYASALQILFLINDPVELYLISEIITDPDLMNTNDYYHIITNILKIENNLILKGISKTLNIPTLVESKYFERIMKKIHLIKNVDVLEAFNNMILKTDKNKEYFDYINNLKFKDEDFSKVVLLVDKIFNLLKKEVNLNCSKILDIIFFKILALPNCGMMVPCLEELESLVYQNLKEDIVDKNTVSVNEIINDKIKEVKDKQLTKEKI